jgi:Ricin-type beta-trefoil lectin domain
MCLPMRRLTILATLAILALLIPTVAVSGIVPGAAARASAAIIQKGVSASPRIDAPPGFFEIRNATYPFCLDATGGGSTNGDRVVINTCTGSDTQYWAYDGVDIVNYAHNKCLDAVVQHIGDGDKVQVWSCNFQIQQGWCFGQLMGTCAPGDALSIVNDDGGFCLDAQSQHFGNNDSVQLWQCRGTNNQHWIHYPP